MSSYFELRQVSPATYADYAIPSWIQRQLDTVDKEARILDFGCGFGQLIQGLKAHGYPRVEGADVEVAALMHCEANGHTVHDVSAGDTFFHSNREQFDLIVTQHVLEHIPKIDVVSTVAHLRSLLRPMGRLIVAVPNAQAFTGAYWAYEDFTHQTLYTSGSIYYVLKAAGFHDIQFLDIDCTAGLGPIKTVLRRSLRKLFSTYYHLMCRLLVSPTHDPSPNIFSYEIKVVAR
jgi:predicted TPR repeat methyltransferase